MPLQITSERGTSTGIRTQGGYIDLGILSIYGPENGVYNITKAAYYHVISSDSSIRLKLPEIKEGNVNGTIYTNINEESALPGDIIYISSKPGVGSTTLNIVDFNDTVISVLRPEQMAILVAKSESFGNDWEVYSKSYLTDIPPVSGDLTPPGTIPFVNDNGQLATDSLFKYNNALKNMNIGSDGTNTIGTRLTLYRGLDGANEILPESIFGIGMVPQYLYNLIGMTINLDKPNGGINKTHTGIKLDIKSPIIGSYCIDVLESNVPLLRVGNDQFDISKFNIKIVHKDGINVTDKYIPVGNNPIDNNGEILHGTTTGVTTRSDFRLENDILYVPNIRTSGNVHIGLNAGLINQNNNSIAIGADAGQHQQGEYSIAIGSGAGKGDIFGPTNQGNNCVAIGRNAGENQNNNSIAIGTDAGRINQEINSVAIGTDAGLINQNNNSIAIGADAGQHQQGEYSIAIGYGSGKGDSLGPTNQGNNCVAIGRNAGENQNNNSIAIGADAGQHQQGEYSIAIGYGSGKGDSLGSTNQGNNCVAIGRNAGENQGENSIAIGYQAGKINQGSNCIAIGTNAGDVDQDTNTIILNASNTSISSDGTDRCYINPIRSNTDGSIGTLKYDTITKEVFYDSAKTFVINNPINPNKYLVHACLEGPESGVYYRGIGEIISPNKKVFINLPLYAVKFYDFTVQITGIIDTGIIDTGICDTGIRTYAATEVIDNKFAVFGKPGKFYWHVTGKREDIIVEPSIKLSTVAGDGPYKYIICKQKN